MQATGVFQDGFAEGKNGGTAEMKAGCENSSAHILEKPCGAVQKHGSIPAQQNRILLEKGV